MKPSQSELQEQTDVDPPSIGPTLPSELVLKVILILKQDQAYASLAKLAQTTSAFYNLVIPELYQTITITRTNMLKLEYGYGRGSRGIVTTSKPSKSPEYGNSTGESRGRGTGMGKTRKDLALDHCLRLIIDFPLSEIPGFTKEFFTFVADRLPSDRYGNVEEVVFTGRGLSAAAFKASGVDDRLNFSEILSPFVKSDRLDVTILQRRKTKRIILHLPEEDKYATFIPALLSGYIRQQRCSQALQFVIYGMRLDSRFHLYGCAVSEIHFAPQIPVSELSVHEAWFDWLAHRFLDIHAPAQPRLILYDIPSLFMEEGDRPKDELESAEAARNLTERILKTELGRYNIGVEATPGFIEKIMKRIEFRDSEYGEEKEEYPVSKPKPITSQMSHR